MRCNPAVGRATSRRPTARCIPRGRHRARVESPGNASAVHGATLPQRRRGTKAQAHRGTHRPSTAPHFPTSRSHNSTAHLGEHACRPRRTASPVATATPIDPNSGSTAAIQRRSTSPQTATAPGADPRGTLRPSAARHIPTADAAQASNSPGEHGGRPRRRTSPETARHQSSSPPGNTPADHGPPHPQRQRDTKAQAHRGTWRPSTARRFPTGDVPRWSPVRGTFRPSTARHFPTDEAAQDHIRPGKEPAVRGAPLPRRPRQILISPPRRTRGGLSRRTRRFQEVSGASGQPYACLTACDPYEVGRTGLERSGPTNRGS